MSDDRDDIVTLIAEARMVALRQRESDERCDDVGDLTTARRHSVL